MSWIEPRMLVLALGFSVDKAKGVSPHSLKRYSGAVTRALILAGAISSVPARECDAAQTRSAFPARSPDSNRTGRLRYWQRTQSDRRMRRHRPASVPWLTPP